ncbi:antihemorrhagic factor cHLP-B-like [Syngnathoides biaculeatus]|uniref:antihemorrhagic factor cHLP-B-like n=1 Tax=Syngnathoides biaculeatus TaxID=300417 RepID=UPI002ADDB831|nr:antihemorrhagic factor cHLP-B-like [Syngnathoides biaculeatus]
MMTHLVAVLLWCAAAFSGLLAAPSLPVVTCDKENVGVVARLGVQHINGKHKHGFRFKLLVVQSSDYQQISGGCHIDVNVKLVQSKCHFTNPKPDDQCELWRLDERGAVATCSIEFWVMWGMPKVTSHECTTRPELTNEELVTICPICPKLLPLDDPTAVKAVHDAVVKFNRESQHHKYFTLMEVAHVTMGSDAIIGPITSLQFALVETTCPRGARNTFVPCTPRCPERAYHAFCQTSYYNLHKQVGKLDCEFYPPKNQGPHPTDVPEPVCRPLFHRSPEACICKARLNNPDQAIHHICPFPLK